MLIVAIETFGVILIQFLDQEQGQRDVLLGFIPLRVRQTPHLVSTRHTYASPIDLLATFLCHRNTANQIAVAANIP